MCLKLGEYEKAIESFEELTKTDPDDLSSWHNKIFAYRKLWRLNEAESALNEALKNDYYGEVWYHRGLFHSEIGELKKSQKDFETALLLCEQRIKKENLTKITETQLLLKGLILYRLGKYEDALNSFEEILTYNTESSKAWLNIGYTFLELRRYNKSKEAFYKSATFSKNGRNILARRELISVQTKLDIADSSYHIALINYELGRESEARIEYKKCLEYLKEPDLKEPKDIVSKVDKYRDVDSYWERGLACFYEPKLALRFYHKALKSNTSDATSWKHKGFALIDYLSQEEDFINITKRQKLLNKALAYFEKSAEINTKDPEAWTNKGLVNMLLANYYRALEDLETSLELSPNSGETWFIRGLVCLHVEHYREANESFQRSTKIFKKEIQINSNSLSSLYNSGLAFYYLDNNTDSLSFFEKVSSLNRSYNYTLYIKGLIYIKLCRYPEALKVLTEFISISRSKAYALSCQGRVYHEQEDYSKAVLMFTKAINRCNNNKVKADACAKKSLSLWKCRKHSKSDFFYKAAKLDEIVFLSVLNSKALFYFYKGKNRDAYSELNKAISLYPSNYEAWYWKGLFFYYHNQYKNAIWAFGKAIKIIEGTNKTEKILTESCEVEKNEFEQQRKSTILANIYYRKGVANYHLYKFKRNFKVIDYVNAYHWKCWPFFYYIISQNILNFLSGHLRFLYKYLETDGYEKAINCLNKAININPDHLDACNYKARILYDMERYEKSKNSLEGSLIKVALAHPAASRLSDNYR